MGRWSPRPTIRFGTHDVPAFPWWAAVGLVTGVVIGWWRGRAAGLTPGALAVLAAGAVAVLGAALVAQAAVRARVNLVAQREAGLVLGAVALCCRLTGTPVAVGLDVAATGITAALALGRLGCHAAGCCHGRPADRGIRYGAEHVALGFPPWLAGVRLVPAAALEAAGLVLLLAAAVALPSPQPAGTAFGFLCAGYALLRAGLEPYRGDAGRPNRGGLRTAQWAAAGIGAAVIAAAIGGLLPGWLGVPGALAVVVVAADWARRWLPGGSCARLCSPGHVAEFAAATGSSAVTTTSLGIRVSRAESPDTGAEHYVLSRVRPLTTREIRTLGTLLRRLRHADRTVHAIPGTRGIVHLVVPPGR
ncbi:prolipoprotein diacylglyceryl transferase family protein [Amycolatopsis sp. NPDC005003]